MAGTEVERIGPDAQRRTGSRPSGLVYFSTSDTIQLDQQALRRKRTRKSTITAARLLQEQLSEGGHRTYPVMVTLTYAAIDRWSSKHVSAHLKTCREWFRRRGYKFDYLWVAELQKRGAVHYHVLIWMPKKLQLPKPDNAGWWRHGMTKIEKVRNAVGYAAKYVSKDALNHKFPRGLRLCGRGGLSRRSVVELRWWNSPVWVRRWLPTITDVRRTPGGGYLCLETGEWRPSPYEVFLIGGQIYIRNRQHE